MRRGARRVDWTSEEVRYLLDNAGRMPLRELCRRMRRSYASVTSMAHRLRDMGYAVDLRHYDDVGTVCPACGCSSYTIDRTGICEPCRRRWQLQEIRRRTAALWDRLTAEQREAADAALSRSESRRDRRPSPPRLAPGATPRERDRAMAEWRRACEEVDAANLRREVKAAQKRKERIEKKVRINEMNAKLPDDGRGEEGREHGA